MSTMPLTEPPRSAWNACAAWLYDPFLALAERRGMAALRLELLSAARGRVLEVGAGTGRNLAAYPARLEQLVLSEPDPGMRARLRRRVERGGQPTSVVAAGAEALPFADGSYDTVVSTMVLCTVPDVRAGVRELRRVLRPGGRLLFIEHVRADGGRLARRQDRLATAWRAFAVGCHCNRPTLELLREHFDLPSVDRATWRGMPSIVHPLVVGHAEA
jgi:ubiquinone/menaquinone biosynthesis C-methylase UbiE